MKISILIPAKNEAAFIREILERIAAASRTLDHEVIVIDDGSDDATAELARSVAGTRVLRLEKNQGKGAALAAGLALATGDVVLVQDADLEYHPEDYPALLAPFLEGRARVVYGSRRLGKLAGRSVGVSSPSFYWGGQFLSWLTSFLYGVKMTDVATGYKLFRADVLRGLNLRARGFEFCPEVTGKILKQRIPILEVPISYSPRSIAEGKKIRWTDGMRAIGWILKVRFSKS
jgi:glycosyltransferase involved in cell wall biosynthesis